ncbi:MAG: zf-HC2 domain-containing protein, partial [Actinomycetota bacterium]|nr:zf-HC2 domain-containing protein [Actinomycetota bacterium]
AYGPGIDPTYEIGLVAPIRSFGLLLIRATAVLLTTMGLSTIAALLLPGFDWRVAAWLLPSFGLVTGSLALSTLMHPLRAAIAVAAGWLMAIVVAAVAVTGPVPARAIFGGVMQSVFLVVTVAATTVLITRRERFERGEHQ